MTLLGAPPATPTGVDAELLFREARQRRRRRWVIAGIVSIVVIVIIAVSWIVLTSGTGVQSIPARAHRGPTAGARADPLPRQMVVVDFTVGSQELSVISSTSGHVLRSLTSAVGTFDGTTQATVARSGIVYFDHAGRTGSEPSEQIWSVPLSGGRSTFVADGHTPMVSPNGTFLAYLTWTALTNAPASIVVMNITTGATTTWSYSTNVPEISDLSWAPNSQSLVFTTTTPVGGSWTYGAWSVPLSSPNRSLDAAQPIRLLPHGFWVGYVNSAQAMEVLVHRNFLDQGDWFQPVVVNVATGRVAKRLPVVAGQSEGGPPGSSGQWQIDPSGHYVALIKQRSLPNDAGTVTDLYRWTINGGHPTIVKRGVWGPAWVPGS
jgi:hypothetical protein